MGLESALLSLMAEGVFNHVPDLRIVVIESGVSWLPGFLWRAIKSWRGLRGETVDQTLFALKKGGQIYKDEDLRWRLAKR